MVTIDDLKKYADKLMFEMKEEEYEILLKEFDVVLKQMDLINNIDGISLVEPASFPYKLDEVALRNDDTSINISLNDVLKNSNDILNDQIKVPKVVE